MYVLISLHWIICFLSHWVGNALISIHRKAKFFVIVCSWTWYFLRFFRINQNVLLWCFAKAVSFSFVFVVGKLVLMLIISYWGNKLFTCKLKFVSIAESCRSITHCSFLNIIEGLFREGRRNGAKSNGLRERIELFGDWFVKGREWCPLELKWHKN